MNKAVAEKSDEMYIKINHCEQCGRKLWKGYFMMVPDEVQSLSIKVVCWRCKWLKRSGPSPAK